MSKDPFYFLGIRFWNDQTERLLQELDRTGGMLAVPSAPSLGQASDDGMLMTAYQNSDWCVMDGAYVAMTLRMLGRRIRRISGHQLIEKLTTTEFSRAVPLEQRSILWVVPNEEEETRIQRYLFSQGFCETKLAYYRAPFYRSDEEFNDSALLAKVAEVKPDWIVICLGGGRQEKLAFHLRKTGNTPRVSSTSMERSRGSVILCTGAAIAFFTGGQAQIPRWADRAYLGWLYRIIEKPGAFLPRYAKAAWHFPYALMRHRGRWFKEPESPKRPSSGRE